MNVNVFPLFVLFYFNLLIANYNINKVFCSSFSFKVINVLNVSLEGLHDIVSVLEDHLKPLVQVIHTVLFVILLVKLLMANQRA